MRGQQPVDFTGKKLLPVGTKVRSTDELFEPRTWELDGPLDGEVVGHWNGYNRVELLRPDGTPFHITSYDYLLATNEELVVL